jgi:hypothetical protein
MNQKVDFGSDEFVVENFKIKFRKAAIRKAEFDDYGVDPNTDHFCVVEFWNATKEEDVFQAVCVILTICNDETIGTAGVPYDFDIEGTEDDFDIKFADQVMAEL